MQLTQLAINSISTRHRDLEEAIRAYAGAGFRQVEFNLPLVKNWMSNGASAASVRGLLESLGLHSIGGFEAGVICFGSDESRAANHELHIGNARLIHELGGGILVVGTDGPARPSLEALDTVGDTLSGLADRMKDLDVEIALEFNWSPLVKSLKSAALVCERAAHPKVGILFDPAHYYTTVSKFEDLKPETVRWIKHVHMDDMSDKPADLSNCNSDRVLPGDGVLDLAAIVSRLEQYGYGGDYSIEMFNEDLWQLPAAEAARRCYNSLIRLCS